jgi:hypothetical protein
MLLDKVTKYLEEVKTLINKNADFDCLALKYIKLNDSDFGIKDDCRTKYSRNSIITILVLFKLFATGSVHRTIINSDFKFIISLGKDVLYKIKNSPLINWRSLLFKSASNGLNGLDIITDVYKPWTLPCFIIDDTDIVKRGRAIEFIGKMYSHVFHKWNFGFKSLNLCYWSGKNLLHLDFTFHKELGKDGKQGLKTAESKKRFTKKRIKGSYGEQRALEADTKKPEQVVNMLRRAISKGFQASYVLCDSWFFSTKLLEYCQANNLQLVSRPKFNNWKYTYEGQKYSIGELVKKLQHKKAIKKWNKELKSHYMKIPVMFGNNNLSLFFYKERRRNSQWQAIISTDKRIGAIQVYKIYQNRWAIEVSFKELKQHLGYGKCQSRDFDAHISDATHALMAYNYLSHLKALENYTTIGGIFNEISKQWVKPSIMDRFWKHIYTIMSEIAELFELSLNDLIEKLNTDMNILTKCSSIFDKLTTET